ncbi:MAG: DUF2142 domain-containing protein [Oscillospiraceae bacterium]
MDKAAVAKKIKALPRAVWWTLGYAICMLCAVSMCYYWRVFYSFDKIPPIKMYIYACAFFSVMYLFVFVLCKCIKSFDLRAVLCIVIAGLVFAFATPPFQVPDENLHYLRAYAMSEGRFNFDYERTYPDDVDALMQHFASAWGKDHNYYPIKDDAYIGDSFTAYKSAVEQGTPFSDTREPNLFMVLPYIHTAAAMLLARLVGFGALGILYAGRIANLLVYGAICYFALKNCRRYKPVFAAVMLLPLSLFLGASLNYDSLMLCLSFYAASYYCKDEITDKDMLWFFAAFAVLCAVKGNNILWLALPLILPKSAWKCRIKKWQAAAVALGCALALMFAFNVYAAVFSHNYPPPVRMLDGVNQMEQLRFVLSYPLRFCAITLGSLYENVLFFFKMGEFGMLDINIPLVSAGSAAVLLLSAAFSAHAKSTLSGKSALGLFALAMAYIASVLAAMYITYTPVGMARIIGLQARYFIPAFLLLLVLLSALLSRILEPADKSQKTACLYGLWISGGFAVLSGILLFQHYYIGPVMGR